MGPLREQEDIPPDYGAGDRIRTGDVKLGKLAFYP